ncbi:MAG TPA: amidohydrolase family protein [Acidimicrobiales bacterium]|nr:amidohydrolase family protein [Acidimicrobiales bacterium]
MHDLVIRAGRVIDGSGAPGSVADVAVDGDRIVAVGDDVGPARREIDADGLVVTPGWVDIHTHYDAQATWDPELTPSGWHGVTTVVMGNCGVGFAPAAPDRHDWLIGLMEGVEDIPGAALTAGMAWEWETFPEYLDALERRRWVADVGTQVPHAALRAYVMGERGAADDPATPDELAAMRGLAAEALRAGALGVSTSRTPLHKSIDGALVPGTTVDPSELFALGDAVRDAGHGVLQMALHHPEVPGHLPWLRALAAHTGRRVSVNLQQTDQAPDLWRDVAAGLDAAAAAGEPLWAQVAGRPIGILLAWEATLHPFVLHPTWRRLARLPHAQRLVELRRPEVRAALLAESPEGGSGFVRNLVTGFDRMWPFTGETDYEPSADRTVAAEAARRGVRPEEVALEVLAGADGTGLLLVPLFNYSDGTLDPLHELHRHPRTVMGLADAGAHCGAICDGGMPTFMVTFWARDRERGDRLPLEHVVRRQTRLTAEHVGLLDRGLVAPGYRADLNVIDLDALAVDAPTMAHDLPTGARRFVQRAHGYRATVTAGTVVAEHDQPTGDHPGRLLRGPRPAP